MSDSPRLKGAPKGPLCGNPHARLFGACDCSTAHGQDSSPSASLVPLLDPAAAWSLGYHPCADCLPEEHAHAAVHLQVMGFTIQGWALEGLSQPLTLMRRPVAGLAERQLPELLALPRGLAHAALTRAYQGIVQEVRVQRVDRSRRCPLDGADFGNPMVRDLHANFPEWPFWSALVRDCEDLISRGARSEGFSAALAHVRARLAEQALAAALENTPDAARTRL